MLSVEDLKPAIVLHVTRKAREIALQAIEIINNTRGDIEGKIRGRGDWGGEFKSRMFTRSRCPRQKSRFR